MKKPVYLLLVMLFVYILSACSAPVTPPPTPIPTFTPTALPPTPTRTRRPILATDKLIEGFAAAWAAHNPDELISYYSEDVKSYDATSGGVYYDYLTINDVLHHDYVNGAFDVRISSFFVSDDDRFAATVGTFAQKDSSGKMLTIPYVSLLEISAGQIVWVYDYYGGSSSKALPLQTIPASANQPAASIQVLNGARAMITDWETAYNSKDTQVFMSFYADQAKYTQVIDPDWLVFSKDMLLTDITSKFSSEKFLSRLENFFISKDGRFVAVQGSYDDAKTMDTPLVILLVVENGKIMEQWDYLVYKAVF